MVTFIGEYTSKIDDKGRMVFPAPLKGVLPPGSDMRFVIKKDLFEPCLQMYTMEEWEHTSAEVKSKLNFFNKQHAIFWREYMRDRDVVEPDEEALAIGSGGNYAYAAALAYMRSSAAMSAADIAKASLEIASQICIYTNSNIIVEEL